jgi:hypothetical protein
MRLYPRISLASTKLTIMTHEYPFKSKYRWEMNSLPMLRYYKSLVL